MGYPPNTRSSLCLDLLPFEQGCYYKGELTGNDFLPFFASKASGDIIAGVAQKYPDVQFLILSGHTHHKAHGILIDHNLMMSVGEAAYGYPKIQDTSEEISHWLFE